MAKTESNNLQIRGHPFPLGFMLFTAVSFTLYIISYHYRSQCALMTFHGINDSPFSYRNIVLSLFALNPLRPYQAIRVGIVFSLLCISFSYFERRTSTIYAIIDVFLKNIAINVASSLLVLLINLAWFSDSMYKFPLQSFGWIPIMQIQFIKMLVEKPQQKAIFGMVKIKFIPFLILAITFFGYYETNNITVIVASALGVAQHFYGFQIKLPELMYVYIEWAIPKIIKNQCFYCKDFDRKTQLPLYNQTVKLQQFDQNQEEERTINQ